ncbi:M12 family metallopeptidase [Pedobacter jeongneungensis]|uniref:M12 family metallopeptidase n=1 Tax=Pedobacter jeongneungensis TaxID=947309 RepID=UPI000469912E|nr:M12 family metallopeptidase [Pedobacter jeongneungensis]
MKKIYYAFAVLVIFLSACKKETSVKEEQSQDTSVKVITYHLKNGGQVTVQINDNGEYVVGGDVVLSKDQIAYLEYNKVGDGKTTTPRSTFTAEFQKLWPGGIVYYVINNASHSSLILNSISDWEASTPIRFVQRTNQANYINFQGAPPNGSGDSQLGMIGGEQLIRLAANADKTTVTHEIGHAIGLFHEQTRADRDQYININSANINNTWRSQYEIYSLGTGSEIGTFDFYSIMLYYPYNSAASVGGNTAPQMTKKDGSIWGYNEYLSQGDIDGVNALYKTIYYKVTSGRGEEYQMDDYNESYDTNELIQFYSDPNLTIPLELPRDVTIRVSYTKVEYPYSEHAVTSNMYYDVTIPQGYTNFAAAMETRIHYNGNMGIQAGSYYMGLSSMSIINAFSVHVY